MQLKLQETKEEFEKEYQLPFTQPEPVEEARAVQIQTPQTTLLDSPAYFEMSKYIEMVCSGHSNFCIIEGKGGFAKTHSSRTLLESKGVEYAYLNGFTSPLELYNFLYDNAKDQVILLDDLEGLFENRSVVSILKNITEMAGKRVISWNSTTSKLEGRGNSCVFTSRLILLTNRLPCPDKNPHIQALLSRSFLCRLRFTHKETLEVLREVSKQPYPGLSQFERAEILDFITRNTSEASKDLNIRTLIKIYQFRLFDMAVWKDLALKLIRAEPHREKVWELMRSDLPVKEQETLYESATGRSRADFYRIKRELEVKS